MKSTSRVVNGQVHICGAEYQVSGMSVRSWHLNIWCLELFLFIQWNKTSNGAPNVLQFIPGLMAQNNQSGAEF